MRDYKPVQKRRSLWFERTLELICVFIAVLMMGLQL
jgi:hypothetical protein